MTSKISFFDLLVLDFKRKIWSFCLAVLVFFLMGPVFLMLVITDGSEFFLYEQIVSFLGNSIITGVITFVGAIICAVSGFAYLFSKSKVDLYHSMPVSREKLYFASYLNGFIIYIVPYIAARALCLVIVGANRMLSTELLVRILIVLAMDVLHFLLIYHVAILTAMVTGHLLSYFAVLGIICAYLPSLLGIIEAYCSQLLVTYHSQYDFLKSNRFLSPVTAYMYAGTAIEKVFDLSKSGTAVNLGELGIYLLLVVAATAGLFVLALYLYKRRPSEGAGKSVVFPVLETPLRILCVLVSALGGGIFMLMLINKYSLGWLIFGVLFGGMLAHGIMEILFRFDFKACLQHKMQMVYVLLAAFCVTAIFRLDVFKYDTYLPKADDIESMAMAFDEVDARMNFFVLFNDEYVYQEKTKYIFDNMKLTDLAAPYSIAEKSVLWAEQHKKEYNDGGENLYYTNVRVKYTLKNGREILRNYRVRPDDIILDLEKIYAMKEYKEAANFIYALSEDDIAGIEFMDVFEEKERSLLLNSEEYKEIFKVYKEEWMDLQLDELEKELPVGKLVLSVEKQSHNMGDREYIMSTYINIYKSFTKTIALLKECGIDETEFSNTIDPEKVSGIRVYFYETDQDEAKYDSIRGEVRLFEANADGTPTEEIREICKDAIPSSIAYDNSIFQNVGSRGMDIYVEMQGNSEVSVVYFKDEVPKLLLDAVEAERNNIKK